MLNFICRRNAVELIVVAVVVLLVSADVALAQEKDQRFKYEKLGGVVFASGDDYELKCDIYQPISDQPRPIMLALHGGAWTTGSKFAMIRHARILANRGYVVMALDYRLAPKHKWPAQIHDCKHAVRWIREHAKKYNGDPERVYVFGYSAGGHLASLLATTDADDGLEDDAVEPFAKHSTRVQGIIAGGSPMDFSWLDQNSGVLKHWIGGTRKQTPDAYLSASPVTYVTEDDPVAVMFHGKADLLVPISSPQTFYEKYLQQDLKADLIFTSNGHASTFTQTTVFLQCLHKLEALLAKERTVQKMVTVRDWAGELVSADASAVVSIEALATFIAETKGMTEQEVAEALSSERDGKRFFLQRKGTVLTVEEAVGIDGEKMSAP